MESCGIGRSDFAKARTLDRWVLSSWANIELNELACCCQLESLVSGASGESAAGGSPARKRAVSSGVTSVPCAEATERASRLTSRAANLMVDVFPDFFRLRRRSATYPRPEPARSRT